MNQTWPLPASAGDYNNKVQQSVESAMVEICTEDREKLIPTRGWMVFEPSLER